MEKSLQLNRRLALLLLAPLLFQACVSGRPVSEQKQATELPLSTIAFGACARQTDPQPIWESILGRDPGLFVFMGDNIYSKASERTGLDAEYALLSQKPGFRKLRQEVPVVAIWDDHDFGKNDGGADNPLKDIFQAAFLDFFEEPASSARRQRPGLYAAKIFGPPGQRVQVILLDTRYFRSPLTLRPKEIVDPPGRYQVSADPTATILGETQWSWLESELKRPAEVRLLITSIQAISAEHGWEKWANMPAERNRLFRLIRETGAEGVMLFSGDRHLGEVSALPADDPEGVGYPLFELTSAGLTHGTDLPFEPNRYRVASEDIYREPNFGILNIDWSAADPRLLLQVVDLDGETVIEQSLTLGQLSRSSGAP